MIATTQDRVVGLRRVVGERGSVTFLGFRPRDDQSASLGYETRTWFEILRTLGAYPNSRIDGPDDNPTIISRSTGYVACRFPNGAVSLAMHYRTHQERWPGGFKRDEKQDAEILRNHPLPPERIEVEDFAIAGHKIRFQGDLAVIFRVDQRGDLVAFAGYNCRGIVVDGKAWEFGSAPVPVIGWAPVLAERQVAGGAVLELWLQGAGDITIPCAAKAGRLYLAGGKVGTVGAEVTCLIENGFLKFRAEAGWGQQHLYLLGAG